MEKSKGVNLTFLPENGFFQKGPFWKEPFSGKKVRLTPLLFSRKGPFLEKAIFWEKSKVNPFAFFQKRAFFGKSHFQAKK